MPKNRTKEVEVSKADWESEVPELTLEQLKNQTEILQGLGRCRKKDIVDDEIVDYELKIPHMWKLPIRRI